jgi:hypothetical protein
MVDRMLGPGHDRVLDNCARRFYSRVGSHQQVHKVDRVQANYKALCRSSGWLHLDILHRFGFPNTIITDLGSNFHSHQFWNFCECCAIEVKYVSVAHPQANGQVERANSMILDDLKKRL